jgi:5-methylcytosine-specific restriction endonuclease McrA
MNQRNFVRMRKALAARQKGKCYYCGIIMTESDGVARTSLTLDHYVPKALGGQNTRSNYVAACLDCNNLKGDLMPEKPKVKLKTRKNNHPATLFALCA